MEWIILGLLAAFFSTLYTIYVRKTLREGGDPLVFAFLLDLGGGILLFAPLLLFEDIKYTLDLSIIGIVILISLVCSVVDVLFIKGRQLAQASTVPIVVQIGSVWTLFGATIFLSEPLTLPKLLGVALIIAGNIVRFYTGQRITLTKGVKYLSIAALLYASYTLVSKNLMNHFSPTLLLIIFFLGPAVWMLFYLRFDVKRVAKELEFQGFPILLSALFFSAFLFFLFEALNQGEASRVIPLVNTSVIFSVLMGILFLGEKDKILRKIIASLLVFAGVVLITI